jgi:hypothetical protein
VEKSNNQWRAARFRWCAGFSPSHGAATSRLQLRDERTCGRNRGDEANDSSRTDSECSKPGQDDLRSFHAVITTLGSSININV